MRDEQLTANIRVSSGMLLLKKAFPVRNSNTSSFFVSFVSCKAQRHTVLARLAGEIPGRGLGVRHPEAPMAIPGLRAGSCYHSSHHLRGGGNAIGKQKRQFLPNNAFLYFSRSDTVVFLFSSQKVSVKSWIWSMVLFTRWLSSAYFHTVYTELSQHWACVCLVWWKSPDTELRVFFSVVKPLLAF